MIQCVETGKCYKNGCDAIRDILPHMNAKSQAENIRKVIDTDAVFGGYHWITLNKKIS